MTGEQLKEILYKAHITQADICNKTGMSSQLLSQALKAADIKTGFLEKLCNAFGLNMSFFYPEEQSVITNNNYGTQRARNLANGNQTVNESAPADATKDNLISQLLQQNSQLIQQNAEFMAMIKGK